MPGRLPGTAEGSPSPERTLLSELEGWRTAIARNAALRNTVLRSWELNGFVHGIINQCLYLRICRDWGVIPPDTLEDIASSTGIQERISSLFRDAEGTSPLALFACTRSDPAPWAEEPGLDDRLLRRVLEDLSSPRVPCDFLAFPVIRLAGVYRAFLRREIRLRGGHRAALEETAAARGAGGYPSPPEAAREYLVAQALAKGTDDTNRNRVLDPTCGPGHLLLLAYRHLVNGHGDPSPEDRAPERKDRFRILGQLHGVDPDPRAVEVTRMLLLFSALEGTEGAAGLASGSHATDLCRVLGEQIRCGNAVIGPEYLEVTVPHPPPRRARELGIPVDWTAAFPTAMRSGGFDVVVTEPPTHQPGTEPGLRRYLQQHFQAYHDDGDMTALLMERGISLVSREGTFASLTTDRWLRARYGGPLRKLLSTLRMEEIVLVAPESGRTPEGTGHCILRLNPSPASEGFRVVRVDAATLATLSASPGVRGSLVDPGSLGDGGWTFAVTDSRELRERVKRISSPLSRYVVHTLTIGDPAIRDDRSLRDRVTRDRLIQEEGWSPAEFRPVVMTELVKRYGPVTPEWFMAGKGLPETGGGQESSAGTPGAILCAEHGAAPACTLDTSGALAGDRVVVIPRKDLYLLGILNSSLSRFLFRNEGGTLTPRWLEEFPVYVPDFSALEDTARHDRLVTLVSRMLELHDRMLVTVSREGKQALRRQIDAADREIDELVYGLYGLTDEERRIVEEAAGRGDRD